MRIIRRRVVLGLLVCITLLLFMVVLRLVQMQTPASPGRLVFTDFAKNGFTLDMFDLKQGTRSSLKWESYRDVGSLAVIDELHVYFSACFAQNNPMFCSAEVSEIIAPMEVHKFDHVKQFWNKNYESPVWSPDYKHIAFGILNKGAQNQLLYSLDIHVMDADGTNVRDIAPDENDNGFNFIWSPNSQQIAFACGDDNNLCIVNVDGSHLLKLDVPKDTNVGTMAWSPDGSQIVFSLTAKDFHNGELYLVNADGSNMHRLLETASNIHEYPVWSPDGSRIAFSSEEEQRRVSEIYVIRPDGSDLYDLSRSLDGNEYGAVWSPDSTKVAFFSDQEQKGAYLYIVDADGTNPRKITNNSTFQVLDAGAPEVFWIP